MLVVMGESCAGGAARGGLEGEVVEHGEVRMVEIQSSVDDDVRERERVNGRRARSSSLCGPGGRS